MKPPCPPRFPVIGENNTFMGTEEQSQTEEMDLCLTLFLCTTILFQDLEESGS
jgi:hypothetical protein